MTDCLGGLNWTGGSGGAGIYFVPPFYPCKVTDLYEYIVANPSSYGYSMVIYDDNGTSGSAGTQLDSIYIPFASVFTSSWNNQLLASPITINSGGIYVAWKMNGDGLTLGQNQLPPFSYRTFEILGNTWSQYRYRETEDLMINIGIEKLPPVSGAAVAEHEMNQYFGDFYPNPSADMALISYDIPFNVNALTYQLFDIQGREVDAITSDSGSNNGKIVVNTHSLDSGIYTCKIMIDGSLVVRRLAVTK